MTPLTAFLLLSSRKLFMHASFQSQAGLRCSRYLHVRESFRGKAKLMCAFDEGLTGKKDVSISTVLRSSRACR